MRRRHWKRWGLFLLAGLVTNFVVAVLLALNMSAQHGGGTSGSQVEGDGLWTVTHWAFPGAEHVASVRTRGIDYSAEQAIGPANSAGGDQRTSWAPLTADTRPEWLVLEFPRAVIARELHVYENNAPGALTKVTAVADDGTEMIAWTGADPSPPWTAASTQSVSISKVPLKLSAPTRRIKIYLASDKVPDWNEIDAVALVADDQSTQWAQHVTASSSYGTPNTNGGTAWVFPAWSTLDRTGQSLRNQSNGPSYAEEVDDAFGWPMLSVHGETNLTPTTPGTAAGPRSPGLAGIAIYSSQGGTTRVPLPTRPIWLGVAGNTVFYALAWAVLGWLLFAPRRIVREFFRLRRGACLMCGYDLGYDFVHGCPECGWRRGAAHA